MLGLSTEQQDKQTDKDRVGLGTGPRGQDGIDIHSGKEGLGEEVADRSDVYRGGVGGGGEEGCTRPADRCEVTDAVHHPRALPHPAVLHHRKHAVVPGNRGPEKVLLFLKSSLSLPLSHLQYASFSLSVGDKEEFPVLSMTSVTLARQLYLLSSDRASDTIAGPRCHSR